MNNSKQKKGSGKNDVKENKDERERQREREMKNEPRTGKFKKGCAFQTLGKSDCFYYSMVKTMKIVNQTIIIKLVLLATKYVYICMCMCVFCKLEENSTVVKVPL